MRRVAFAWRLFGSAALSVALAGCSWWRSPAAGEDLVLFGAGPAPGLRVQLAANGSQVDLTGDAARTPTAAKPGEAAAEAQVRHVARGSADSALELRWQNTWSTSLRLVADKPMDLRAWLPDGTVEFDLEVIDAGRSGLSFTMACGADCWRRVNYVLPSRALQGQGRKHLSVALKCFERDGNDFSAVTQPLTLDSQNTGAARIANVRLVRRGTANVECPDYRTQSVTPAPLSEVWSQDWWSRRHGDKLFEVKAMQAAGRAPGVVFIGDSITHGWENGGRAVWDAAFGKYQPLNLGYSGDRTENVLWRLQNGELDGIAPKAAVLMIGTNNTGDRREDPATTAAGVRRVVQELRQRLPGTKVLVLAIFPRDEQPASPQRRLNERVNTLIAALHDGRDVFFLDIGASLMNADGSVSRDVMPDLLHLSEQGYRRWANAIGPSLQHLMSLPQ